MTKIKNELMQEILNQRLGIKEVRAVYQQIREKDKFLEFSKYLYDSNLRVAAHSAWVLTQATDDEIAWLQPCQNELIDLAISTPESAIRRLTLNLLERLRFNADDIRADFLDFCLERMQSLTVPPGVQSLCLKLADKMCSLYPELQDELVRTLETMQVDMYTAAIKCVRKKILARKR